MLNFLDDATQAIRCTRYVSHSALFCLGSISAALSSPVHQQGLLSWIAAGNQVNSIYHWYLLGVK